MRDRRKALAYNLKGSIILLHKTLRVAKEQWESNVLFWAGCLFELHVRKLIVPLKLIFPTLGQASQIPLSFYSRQKKSNLKGLIKSSAILIFLIGEAVWSTCVISKKGGRWGRGTILFVEGGWQIFGNLQTSSPNVPSSWQNWEIGNLPLPPFLWMTIQ